MIADFATNDIFCGNILTIEINGAKKTLTLRKVQAGSGVPLLVGLDSQLVAPFIFGMTAVTCDPGVFDLVLGD